MKHTNANLKTKGIKISNTVYIDVVQGKTTLLLPGFGQLISLEGSADACGKKSGSMDMFLRTTLTTLEKSGRGDIFRRDKCDFVSPLKARNCCVPR